MVSKVLVIRMKQLQRNMNGIGIFRFAFLIALIGFAAFALYVFSAYKQTSRYISIGFLLMITLIQLKREDILFLKCTYKNYKSLILTEYFILSLPFAIIFIMHQQWVALCVLAIIFIIPGLEIKTKSKSLNTKLQDLIPSDAIEWKAGMRKQFYLILPLWSIAALTSFFTGSIPIAIIILGILSLSLYEQNEPYQVLMAFELNPEKFLLLKVKRQLQLFSTLTFPLLILFVIFHPGLWYIPVIGYVLLSFFHLYIIMAKYAFYKPAEKSPANEIFNLIGILGIMIPVFLPVVWLLTIRFYRKSIINLNAYLNDYDK